jgi:two-component system, cell cycle sensor histidine kinase and response regulator CckA
MKSNDTCQKQATELRQRAEEIALKKRVASSETLESTSPEEFRRIIHELQVHQIELEIQNEELLRTQTDLDAQKERYFDLYDLSPVGYLTISEKGLILDVNLAASTLVGMLRKALIGQPLSRFIHREDQDIFYLHLKQLLETRELQTCQLRMVKEDSTIFWGHLESKVKQDAGGTQVCLIVLIDISEKKFQEDMIDLATRLIAQINTPDELRQRMSSLSDSLQKWSGCEVVGIRLKEGDDYPYYETRGFPAAFVQAETRLCVKIPNGEILRDSLGNPVLECMCGNILSGRFDPAKPFFTANGSFWSNNTTDLLATTTDVDRQARTRNRCNGEGYESVALVPLRIDNQILGLLQFNDHHPDRFSPALVGHFEKIAGIVAVALWRHQAEERLQKSEALYRGIGESIDYGVWVCAPDGRNTYASESFLKMVGITQEQCSDFGWGDVLHPDDAERTIAMWQECVHTGDKWDIEHRFRGTDGEWHWVLARGVPIRDKQGEIISWAGINLDITKRKQDEEHLRQSEEKFRTVANHIYDWEYWRAPDGSLVYVSPSCERITGYRAEEFSQEPGLLISILHPDDRKNFWQHEQDPAKGAAKVDSQTVEFRILTRNGEERLIEHICRDVFSQDGTFLGRRVSNRDMTERKRAEVDLLKSERLYRSLFDNMMNGFAYCKMLFENGKPQDFIYLAVNDAFGQQTGLKNVVGRKVTEVIPGIRDRDPELFEIYGRVAMTREPTRFEIFVDALRMWFSISVYSPSHEHFVAVFDVITERKRAEEELRKSEAHFRTLVQTIPDLIWLKDEEGVYLACNKIFERLFGAREEDIVGKTDYDFVDRELADFFRAHDKKAIAAGKPSSNEEWVTFSDDGHRALLETIKTPMYDDRETLIGVLGIGRDITERQRNEEALQHYAFLMKEMGKAAKIGGWEFDVATGKGTWTEEVALIHEVDPKEATNLETGISFYTDESKGKITKAIQDAIETGKPYVLELELITAKGNHKWVKTIGYPIIENNKVLKLRGSFQDITERKRAEEALRESETRLKLVLDGSQLGFWDWNIETGEVIRNDRWAEMLGYTLEEIELSVEQWTDLHHPDDREFAWKSLQDHLEGRTSAYTIEYRMLTKDGQYKWVLDQARIVSWDSQGKPLRMCGTHTDITERKFAEQEREKLQAQLSQAQKMESVGRLAGGVAHDFNNMLSVIIGYTEMALNQVDPSSPLHQDLHEIYNAGKRSADITQQLLAFARKQTIQPKILDLNVAIEGMLKMLQRLIGEDIDLAWQPKMGLGKIKIDPSQLDQLLANLCVNSRDAIKGVGKITVETSMVTFDEDYCANHEGSTPGVFILLAVSDDGCGMDKEILNKVFEPFFTTKEAGKGTGLGLATVYGIVRQNNGFVNVYSEPGHGTTFNIYLPVHQSDIGENIAKTVADIPSGGNETILIVEDEALVLKLAKSMLERLGYTVVTAKTPIEAIRMAEDNPSKIHLVITDVIMPEMNGRDLSDRFHSLYPDIKTLFMSGYTANVIAHRGILDEGVCFIHKPFSIKDLAVKVREALELE